MKTPSPAADPKVTGPLSRIGRGDMHPRYQMVGEGRPLRIDTWPRAILHVDGDAFFASVEQAIHPELKGRPVVTGVERGIVSAASYEAKARGVQRGVSLTEAKRICPEAVFVSSDYETYSLFSKKMFAILREFTPMVEEYSIDEAFADLTGLRRFHHCSYPLIAQKIKTTIEKELGITVSVGLSLSKSLAKLCSKFRKPSGFTAVSGRHIHLLLERTPLATVWGFGPNTTAYLIKMGLKTALDFVGLPHELVQGRLGKTGSEIWRELRGDPAYSMETEPKESYQSISKFKTFLPASSDPSYLLAQLLRNLESACIKARRYDLAARSLVVSLRRQDFSHIGCEADLSRPTAATLELVPIARQLFLRTMARDTPGRLFRQTGVVLGGLQKAGPIQFGIFDDPLRILKVENASAAIDQVNEHYGKHTLHVAEALFLQGRPRGKNDAPSSRLGNLLEGETRRQHIGLPMLALKV
jgi:DNA polymerase IV